jgi:hypothetical protein
MNIDFIKFLKVAFVDHDAAALTAFAWILSFFAYIVLQIWFGYAWKGRWRVAALLALIGPVIFLIMIFVGLSYYPDQFGPYPQDISDFLSEPILAVWLFAPLGFIYLAIAGIARLIARRPGTALRGA